MTDEASLMLTIKVNYPDDKVLDHHLKGPKYHDLFSDIHSMVFRPARKHGYEEIGIRTAMEECGESAEELIYHLENKFFEILTDAGVVLD